MMKKRIKKISKLLFLIGVRQIWKLLCNIYHILTQPLVTLKLLIKEKDKSQIFLLGLTVISPLVLYITARIVWDSYKYGHVLSSVGRVFLGVLLLETIIFSYIFYWLIIVLKRK